MGDCCVILTVFIQGIPKDKPLQLRHISIAKITEFVEQKFARRFHEMP
jgi:hypothetical protein